MVKLNARVAPLSLVDVLPVTSEAIQCAGAVVDDQWEAAVYETQASFAVQLGQNYMLISGQICKPPRERSTHAWEIRGCRAD